MMIEQGTPRAETLIVDALDGRLANPKQMNPYMPATPFSEGLHQVCMLNLWENNGTNGDMLPIAATAMPVPNADKTKWTFSIQQGMAWSDGIEFTSDDIVWTLNTLLTNKDLPANAYWTGLVKSATAIDKYTVEVDMLKPYARFEQLLGNSL
jgi:peptide/nickel transport system substrate-binding protein